MAIPSSVIVSVNPSVLSPGGTGIVFAGMFLTQNTRVPTGAPTSFATAKAVSDYFGSSSDEYALAKVYFQGYDGSTLKPGLMWFAQHPLSNVAAYLRGAAVASLAAVQAITAGHLSVTIDGVAKSTTTLDLSAAASLSAAATAIATALSLAGGQTCTFDSQSGAFVITSGTTGATSTITFGTASAGADALKLGSADGGVLSQGMNAVSSESAYLDQLTTYTTNWGTLVTVWEPTTQTSLDIATWISASDTRFMYSCSDSDATVIETPASFTGLGKQIANANLSGTALVFNSIPTAAMIAGYVASLDFTELNGRAIAMFRTNSQITSAVVTDETAYDNMIANGYSSYCQFTTEQKPEMLANGQISGDYKWIDSYVGAMRLKIALEAAMINLLQTRKSVPYNNQGYALIAATALDPINAALNFGTIRTNVKPSASQAADMNADAGVAIDGVVGTRGWYLAILPTDAVTRAARQSPPIKLYYMDGEAVQQLVINAIDVL